MNKDSFSRFFVSSLVFVLVMIASLAAYFSNEYIDKELERGQLFQQQLTSFFAMKSRSMSEQMWTGSYEAIDKDVYNITAQVRSKFYSVDIFDETGNCVYTSKGDSCAEKNILAHQVKSYLDSEHLDFEVKEDRYVYQCPLMVGSILKGYLVAKIADPYQFYRGNFFVLFISVIQWPLILLLLAWFFWSRVARHYFLRPYLNHVIELERKNALADMAAQVAHDIRSPLAALEMVSSQLDGVSADRRVIVRNSINRIRDITNSLTGKKRSLEVLESKASLPDSTKVDLSLDNQELVLLVTAMDSIITEKRMQYRDLLNVEIRFDYQIDSYGLFVKVNLTEFSRVISNVIDNAVESLPLLSGIIELFLTGMNGRVTILIKDSGCGIAEDALSKVGIRGVTFGKSGGSGLGLAHAKETLKAFRGILEIESQVGVGTGISIILPMAQTPPWFVPKLSIAANQTVVVLDDDESVHQIWTERFSQLGLAGNSINLKHMSSGDAFRAYFRNHFFELETALFLVDYEILGFKENGLDIVESLGISAQTILVTSRYEEKTIRERCERNGIKLIPKPMCGFIPFELIAKSLVTND